MGRVAAVLFALLAPVLPAQETPPPQPDARTLMREVQAHQKHMDEVRENYTFHQILATDDLDPHGAIKKTETEEREMFFVNGRRVDRLVKRDGRDLSPEERRSEDARVMKEAKKYSKDSPADSREMIRLSRVLDMIGFTSPHRTVLNGRATLVFDFAGNRNSKAHGLEENAAKRVTGTAWVDEQDHDVAQLEAGFHDTFRIGAGLLATIQKGTSIRFEQVRIADGIWMPSTTEIHLAARELLVNSLRQNIHVKDFDYRRFEVGFDEHQSPPPQ